MFTRIRNVLSYFGHLARWKGQRIDRLEIALGTANRRCPKNQQMILSSKHPLPRVTSIYSNRYLRMSLLLDKNGVEPRQFIAAEFPLVK